MAGQTAAQLGIKAPAGGFQDGGWYNARNYDAASGTFGDPGQIWSKSLPQSGTMVSPEVNRASSVAAGLAPNAYQDYINAGAPVTGYKPPAAGATTSQNSSSVDFGGLLNGVQGNAYTSGGVQSVGQILQDLKDAGLYPTGSAPTPPNLSQQYQDLLDAKGVPAIQAAINDLKAQSDALDAQTRTNVSAERGKPVAENVIEGRVGIQQRNAQEQQDFITRQLTTKQNELNAALTNIQTIMQLTQTDYSNASDAYNKQFDQAISTINLVQGIQQDQKNDLQKAQDNARANAQILYNAIREGGISMSNLPAGTQAQLNSLEVQAGLPVGFFQAIKADPKADIIATSSNNGVTQVLFRNQDGSVSVQSYGTSTSGSSTSDKNAVRNAITSDAAQGKSLSQIFNAYTALGQQVGISANDIYTLYNSSSKYGSDKNSNAVPGTGYLSNYGVTLFK